MGPPPEQVASEVGTRLAQGRLNKDALVKLLKQGETALSELDQSVLHQSALAPLCKSLVQSSILDHKDKEVRLLAAVCLNEIIRVLAPDPLFSDEVLKDVFKLIVNIFGDLADVNSPYHTRRFKILKNIAAIKYCLLMLDIGCDKLIKEMFDTFFAVVRNEHQQSLVEAMSSIMTLILEEKVSPVLLNTILRNLLKDDKGSSASSKLAISVIQKSAEKLKPHICKLLTSLIMEKDDGGNDLAECNHELISRIFQFNPRMLDAVIPNLTLELITDQVDVRMKAITLVGKLFVQSNSLIAEEFHSLFVEFINRFSDKSTEVRLRAVECAKACYTCNTSSKAANILLSALEGRLLDTDEKVRSQAVMVLCDLAACNLKSFPANLVLKTVERIRDKKVNVRKKTMKKLLELYRAYCLECSEGFIPISDHFEQIPPKILLLCFDKDCQEFRPQSMELVLAEDLFPPSLSLQERASHWMAFFSFFTLPHKKALTSILSQKRRLQMEFKVYASFSQDKQDNISASIQKMAGCFTDSSKAVECFQKLHQFKDNHIFNALLELIDERTDFASAKSIRDSFLRRIGDKHPNFEFFRTLSVKCSHSLFTCEHVYSILEQYFLMKGAGNLSKSSSIFELLSTIVNVFPLLLSGSEVLFMKLFDEVHEPKETLLQILARAVSHLSVSLSDIYPLLERVCLAGVASEPKYAVLTIASLTDSFDSSMMNVLFEKLIGCLHNGRNLSTVLQSLLCMLKHSLAPAMLLNDLADVVFCNFFPSVGEKNYSLKDFNTESLCKIKVLALKILVKIFLTQQLAEVKLQQVRGLLTILYNILQCEEGADTNTTSRDNLDELRLTAAKSVLHLSLRWDLHIFPQLFHQTVLMARYPSLAVQKALLNKIHNLLEKHALPIRFSCAYALITLQSSAELQVEAQKYLADSIQEYHHKTVVCKDSSLRDDRENIIHCSEYIVVYLIHILAHDKNFPSKFSEENTDITFFYPLVLVLRALLHPCMASSIKDDSDTISFLLGIFYAIKKAEDAANADITPKLHALAHIGLLITKELSPDLKPSMDGPGIILLPSAFYKVSDDIRNREKNSSTHLIPEGYISKMLKLQGDDTVFDSKGRRIQNSDGDRNIESKVALPSTVTEKSKVALPSTVTEKSKVASTATYKEKSKIASTATYKENSKVALMSTDKENSSSCQTNILGTLSVSGTGRGDQFLPSVSVEMRNEISGNNSTIQEPVPELHRCSEPTSSCGSAITRPFSDSQVAASQVILVGQHEHKHDNTVPSSRIVTEQIKRNRCKKDLSASKEVLVGSRISLWSPLNKCFCSGTVDSYDSQNNTHKVTYDNGDIEQLHLHGKRWEIIGSTCSTDKDGTPRCKGSMESSDHSLTLFDDIFGDESSQEDPIPKGKATAKKKPELSISAASDLRRSKRLKKT